MSELRRFAREVNDSVKHKGKARDFLKFYASNIVHYFMGFLAVPKGRGRLDDTKAPKDTVCVVQPYPMHPVKYGMRWAICMESPSPILDFYYRSILDVFSNSGVGGYLDKIDPITMRVMPKEA